MLTERTILLVDDSVDDTMLIRRAFKSAGFENPLQTVPSAHIALQYLRGEGSYADRAKFPFPHLLLLDHRMPGMSGWEVLEWIRKQPVLNSLPVIIFSGSDSPGDEKKATEMGATAYIAKPVSFTQFVDAIKRIAEFWLLSPGKLPADDPNFPNGQIGHRIPHRPPSG